MADAVTDDDRIDSGPPRSTSDGADKHHAAPWIRWGSDVLLVVGLAVLYLIVFHGKFLP